MFRRFAKAHSGPRKAGPSKAEQEYESILSFQQKAGTIGAFWPQGITLKLADGVRYTPDFLVLAGDGVLECHEVKGGKYVEGRLVAWQMDDARVKCRVAARLFPFRFVLAIKGRKNDWKIDLIGEAEAA